MTYKGQITTQKNASNPFYNFWVHGKKAIRRVERHFGLQNKTNGFASELKTKGGYRRN